MKTNGIYDFVIIGGGITGLSCAYYLKDRGLKLALIDGAGFGGEIQTKKLDGFTLECGPNVIALKPDLLQLLHDLDLSKANREPAVSNYKQMVFYNGEAQSVPKGPLALFSTPLLNISQKLNLVINIFYP